MKKILFAAFLSLGLISCSSCAKAPQTEPAPVPTPTVTAPPPEPPPPAPVTVIAQENWSFDPGEGWKVLMPPDNTAIKIALVHPTKKLLVILTKEEFQGTTEQYSLLAMRSARDSGATVASVAPVEINGTKYVLVETFKTNANGTKVSVWQWVGVKASLAYGLTCGGPASVATVQSDCQAVASTLKIN
jgi:hypothetical protein